MRRFLMSTLSLSLLLAGGAVAAQALPAANLSAQAKVSMKEARQIALKTYPGQVVKQELEKESGGSGLRYSFDIKSAKATHEVGVDAKTGKVLENSVEGADND
ncbi:MAG: peptidase M4 [Rhodanobacter sp.]|nr:MAG: peptidase M4 [Rhodanobacter sp.]TAL98444.1 MAG: peptidase M4 [Rhodanobacter sp.]TAM42217.1 MAG: peptidase M4 [Rhodanobacter sp.]TAN26440.1 MAG: peptidase M4 [Rhodanobacter sp.]